jgi:hypothetical protein
MELITILNRCHRFPGFVYQHAHFSADKKSIEVSVRPRKGSAAICRAAISRRAVTFSRKPSSNSGITTHRLGPANSSTIGAAKPCDPASNP